MEIWKDISNFKGYYQISNYGRVRSLTRFDGIRERKGQMIKPILKSNGYLQVGLRKKGKRKYMGVHRLVAQHFLDNHENKSQVNHIDCNKQNNNVTNLEWVTPRENLIHAHKNGLVNVRKGKTHPFHGKCGALSKSAKPVIRFNRETGEMKLYKAKILAKDDGFDPTSISKCCHKKMKTHKGYEWYFAKDFDKDIV